MKVRDRLENYFKKIFSYNQIFNLIVFSFIISIVFYNPIYKLIQNHKLENLSQLLQGGTILLYALYIPIAIAIFQFFFSKKYIPQINIKTFLGRVFSINTHILLILVSIVAAILIDTGSRLWIFFGIGLWIGSTIKIILDLKTTTLFITSSDKAKYWFDFLEKTNAENFIKGIQDVFDMAPSEIEKNIEKENRRDDDIRNYTQWSDTEQENFINLIIDKINEYDSRYQYAEVYSIFKIIYDNISKINFRYRNQDFIKALFKWRYEFFKIYIQDNKGQNTDLPIYGVIDQILLNVLQQSIKDNEPISGTIDFFNTLQQHLLEYKDEIITFKGDTKAYFEWFRYFGERVITEILNLEDIFKAERILDYHWKSPERKWQITIDNLSSDINKDSKITGYWLEIMRYYIHNIWRKDFDRPKKIERKDIRKVNTLLNAFVPNINSGLFIQITELWFWISVPNKVEMYINNQIFSAIYPSHNAFISDNISSFSDDIPLKKDRDKEEDNTIDIIIKIYENYNLNKEFCKDILNQIKQLELKKKYKKEPEKRARLLSLKTTIEVIDKKLGEKSKE